MAVAKSPSSNLEDRLALVSRMLEEAVALLRSTMTEVKRDGAARYDRPEAGGGTAEPPPHREI